MVLRDPDRPNLIHFTIDEDLFEYQTEPELYITATIKVSEPIQDLLTNDAFLSFLDRSLTHIFITVPLFLDGCTGAVKRVSALLSDVYKWTLKEINEVRHEERRPIT